MSQPNTFQPPPNAFQQPPNTFQPPQANAFQPQPYGQHPPHNTYAAPPYAPPYQQPPQQPPAPFGRGGGPQPPFNGYQQPPAAYGAPPFNSPPHNQFQQVPPPHVQQRHQQPPSLPLPHQIPGLPPKPNVPGLPPRPSFANPSSGFGRGHVSAPPTGQWSPPVPQHHHHEFSQPVALPYAQGQAQQFNAGYNNPHQQTPPQPYGGFPSRPSPANSIPLGPQHVTTPRTEVQPATGATSGTLPQPVSERPAEKQDDMPVVKPKRETKLVYGDNISPVSTSSDFHDIPPSANLLASLSIGRETSFTRPLLHRSIERLLLFDGYCLGPMHLQVRLEMVVSEI